MEREMRLLLAEAKAILQLHQVELMVAKALEQEGRQDRRTAYQRRMQMDCDNRVKYPTKDSQTGRWVLPEAPGYTVHLHSTRGMYITTNLSDQYWLVITCRRWLAEHARGDRFSPYMRVPWRDLKRRAGGVNQRRADRELWEFKTTRLPDHYQCY
jgi:hypothetical protein